jgi:2-polyprenyl-3-methyl-5-hydroxy-6-metoxy-1,4-benzoquinol methylase
LKAFRDLSRIRSHAGMISRRQQAFLRIKSNPREYTATRELEQLSQTPISTAIILDQLDKNIGKNVLEVGAGLGLITKNLLQRGRFVSALEPDSQLFKQLDVNLHHQNLKKFNSTLAAWNNEERPGQMFDTILYVNVLEHIDNDVEELQNAAKFCTANGRIVVFVPSNPALYGTMDWMSAHFRRYRKKELEKVAMSAGLKIHSCEYFDAVGKVPYFLMYRLLRKTTLGSSSVGIYDKLIVPLSAKVPHFLTQKLGGKNLVLIASPLIND